MPREEEKLDPGKGVAFDKGHLKRLRQEDDTWEADFFPIPCSGGKHDSVWMGLVLSHAHEYVLAQRMLEEPPTVNDLARLLADAMQQPTSGPIHRPRRLYLRARPEWADLLPHLKQIGIQVVSQEELPRWDRAFGDLLAQVEQARAAQGATWPGGDSADEVATGARRGEPMARSRKRTAKGSQPAE